MADRVPTPYTRDDLVQTGHFDVGPGYYTWRPGGTDDCLIILTLAGGGRFSDAGGRGWTSVPGDLVLIRPGVPHDYQTDRTARRWELLWTHCRPRPDWDDLLDWPDAGDGIGRLRLGEDRADIADHLLRLHRAALTDDPLRERVVMNRVEALLLACDVHNPGRGERRLDARIRRAVTHITTHLGERFVLSDLADLSGLSVSRFAHRFREVVGQPPATFIEQRRLDRAKQLLTTTALSVKEIAVQLGYDSQFYFSLRFKKAIGQNPTAYRQATRTSSPRVADQSF